MSNDFKYESRTSASSDATAKVLVQQPFGIGRILKTASGCVVALSAGMWIFGAMSKDAATSPSPELSPIYGVAIPKGYRAWPVVAPALEMDPLNELRVVVGNSRAITAYGLGTLPFPDGTILTKLAWQHVPSPEFPPALVPGRPTTVQVMVKDSKRYASTGGWGFGRFVDGRAVDIAQHKTCFACHQALVKNHDFVFTRYAR